MFRCRQPLGRLLRHRAFGTGEQMPSAPTMTRRVDHAAINDIDMEHSHAIHTELDRHTMTKIVATVGPASNDPGAIQELCNRGLSIMRLNFSHADYEQAERDIRSLRGATLVHKK